MLSSKRLSPPGLGPFGPLGPVGPLGPNGRRPNRAAVWKFSTLICVRMKSRYALDDENGVLRLTRLPAPPRVKVPWKLAPKLLMPSSQPPPNSTFTFWSAPDIMKLETKMLPKRSPGPANVPPVLLRLMMSSVIIAPPAVTVNLTLPVAVFEDVMSSVILALCAFNPPVLKNEQLELIFWLLLPALSPETVPAAASTRVLDKADAMSASATMARTMRQQNSAYRIIPTPLCDHLALHRVTDTLQLPDTFLACFQEPDALHIRNPWR